MPSAGLHKFAVGQTVRLATSRAESAAPSDSFEVVKLLPPQSNDNQYRIKSKFEKHERMVGESRLNPA